jgi:SPP1 gp7 family putative phage head morphogenesis protein
MRNRFNRLANLVRRAVVDEDCLVLLGLPHFIKLHAEDKTRTPGERAFNFSRSADKVAAFMDWVNVQIALDILEITTGYQFGRSVEDAWTNKYVTTAYQKGILRARQELRRAGYQVPEETQIGGVSVAFNQPFHLERVGLLYTRTFSELKGITAAMDSQISRVLAQGMADGLGPIQIARNLVKAITGIGADLSLTDTLGRSIPARRRAETMARTEIIRAHHVATIQEYRNWGVVGVTVEAEWRTAGDTTVCPVCRAMEGRVFSLDAIEKLIPLHPECRCCALPVTRSVREAFYARKAV